MALPSGGYEPQFEYNGDNVSTHPIGRTKLRQEEFIQFPAHSKHLFSVIITVFTIITKFILYKNHRKLYFNNLFMHHPESEIRFLQKIYQFIKSKTNADLHQLPEKSIP